jgi:hypothetical protein
MCASAVRNFRAFTPYDFDVSEDGLEIRRPIILRYPKAITYTHDDYRIGFKKSDYGRSKLFNNGKNLTLYSTLSSEENFPMDEKCIFLTEEKHLNVLLYGIHHFNYDACSKCLNIDCVKKIIESEPENNTILSDDLFNI